MGVGAEKNSPLLGAMSMGRAGLNLMLDEKFEI